MSDKPTAGSSAIQPDGRYTVADYLSWPQTERWELIHGVPYNMSPAPSVPHQRVVLSTGAQLSAFTRSGPCETLVAPTDLFLPRDDADDTVVQPDVMVICDPDKIDDRGVTGAPDLIVEVLSDSTAYKDLSEKRILYEAAGVREYWAVNLATRTVLVWRLIDPGDRRYAPVKEYRNDDPVDSSALPGFIWTFPEG